MKLISWNVNGLRACLKKGFEDTFNQLDADVFCIQETKMQPGQADFAPEGYAEYINSAEKKGYSGTLIYTRVKPLNAWNGIGVEAHSHEGRAITLEFEDYYLVNVYVPNSQNELARIDYRMQWEDDLRAYLKDLDSKKPVILCGDLNVAHEDIDLKNPGPNRGAAGFSDQERGKLNELLAAGFTDSFRYLYPDATGMYSWWSMRFRAREFVIVCFMDIHPVQRVLARGRLVQHADNIHQGTFAGAGFTHNSNELPRPHSQINAVQDFQLVRLADIVTFADAAHGNQRAAVGLPRPKALHNGIDKRLFILRHISYLPVRRPGRRPRHRRGRPPGRPHRQSVHHRRQ